MDSPNTFFHKLVNLESSSFFIKIQKFENGFFISVSEDSNKLGSIVASLGTGSNPITTTIIPEKTNSLFLKLVAERLSTKYRGIVMISTFFKNELNQTTAKTLMSEIINLIEDDN